MADVSAAPRAPGRPRSPELDTAILDAALQEYANHGYDGLSVDAVAARAGTSKATIYRRYPAKLDLVADALYREAEHKPLPDTGELIGDLRILLDHLRDLFIDPALGAALRHMAADAPRTPELNVVHDDFIQGRRAGTKLVLQRAIDRGELPAGMDLELGADLLTGPPFLRHMVTHMPVDRRYLQQVLDAFLRTFT